MAVATISTLALLWVRSARRRTVKKARRVTLLSPATPMAAKVTMQRGRERRVRGWGRCNGPHRRHATLTSTLPEPLDRWLRAAVAAAATGIKPQLMALASGVPLQRRRAVKTTAALA
jgi:hypothetical protein